MDILLMNAMRECMHVLCMYVVSESGRPSPGWIQLSVYPSTHPHTHTRLPCLLPSTGRSGASLWYFGGGGGGDAHACQFSSVWSASEQTLACLDGRRCFKHLSPHRRIHDLPPSVRVSHVWSSGME